jgi:ubiquinol-cytochrome c reductase cytochrome b subunit
MLKSFPGRLEWVGSIAVPGALMTTLFLLPLLDKVLPSKPLHFLVCAMAFAIAGGAGYLTLASFQEDARNPAFHLAREKADRANERALFLAAHPDFGIPPEGAGYLMRLDPLTRGTALLEKKCLGCHRLGDLGTDEQSAPDLKDFGSLAWIRGLLEHPESPTYFGKTPECDGMIGWKKTTKLDAKQLDQVAEFVASFAGIPEDQTVDDWLNTPGVADHPGNELFQKDCGKCHMIDGYTEGGVQDAPDLFAWGSHRWMKRMIRKPGDAGLYGYLEDKQRMPASPVDEMPDSDVSMIIRYLKGDYLKPAEAKP